MHLLNLGYPPELGSQLCCQVLATLTALLAGNEASRNRVRDDVGYDTLFSIITRLVGPAGPSEELLLHMLGFVLEVSPALTWRPLSTIADCLNHVESIKHWFYFFLLLAVRLALCAGGRPGCLVRMFQG